MTFFTIGELRQFIQDMPDHKQIYSIVEHEVKWGIDCDIDPDGDLRIDSGDEK